MSAKNPYTKKITVQNIVFYFDGVARDRMDQGLIGQKYGEFLSLRDKLLALPEGEFEVTIKAIRNMVAPMPKVEDRRQDTTSRSRREALELFERVGEATQKTPAPEKVSRV